MTRVDIRRAWRQAPLSMWMATVGGIGHIPGGPGTYAAAVFTPAIVWMSGWPLWIRLSLWVLLTLASIPWCERAGEALNEHDSRRVVLDEVVGVWTTLVWFDELGWLAALVGLVAFRILDVLKPPPADWLDTHGKGGFSVVMDDVVAGVWAIPAVLLVRWFVG